MHPNRKLLLWFVCKFVPVVKLWDHIISSCVNWFTKQIDVYNHNLKIFNPGLENETVTAKVETFLPSNNQEYEKN